MNYGHFILFYNVFKIEIYHSSSKRYLLQKRSIYISKKSKEYRGANKRREAIDQAIEQLQNLEITLFY